MNKITKKITNYVALVLCVTLLLQLFAVPGIGNWNITAEAANSSETITYEDEFDYGNDDRDVDTLISTDKWDVETYHSTVKYTGTKPQISDGVLKMNTTNSVQFNWINAIGLDNYDSSKTYTFEFDATVTKSNDTNKGGAQTRVLYVAPGGYYNQIEINDQNGKIAAGGDTTKGTVAYTDATYTNQKLHLKLEWQGTKITSTITDENGTKVTSGYRDKTNYSSVKSDALLRYLVLRCEDGAVEIDNFSFTDGTTTYTEDFGTNPIDTMMDTDIWDIGDGKTDATAPRLENGVIKMYYKDSLKFNWMKVSEVEVYDSSMTYTFEFDVTVKDSGDGSKWGSDAAHTRILYVAPGEYWNLIELNNSGDNVVAGKTPVTYDEALFKDQTVHIKIEWRGNTIVSTVTDAEGKIIVRGRRTETAFTDMTKQNKAMQDLTLRCEDGAVDIDNFKFTKSYVEVNQLTKGITIPEGKQAIYECEVQYNAGSNTRIEISGTTATATATAGAGDLFEISDYGMAIGGFMCEGTYGEGVYKVKAYLNPTQKAVNVEVTLPDGGVIRRGSHQFLYSCTSYESVTTEWSNITTPITDETVTYKEITNADYEILTEEPDNTDCGGKVYNLITSYDGDAKTTRSFAWTTVEGYVGDTESMSVRYRKAGTDTWTTVAAIQEAETTNIAKEDFFKADIKGLVAGTSYEYQVGKTDSENDDWSATYSFTTEKSEVDEFSFVAIGDTQGAVWYGTGADADTKGYQYTHAAVEQAMKDVENPAMILHTGDVTENGSLEQWNSYFKTLGDYGKTIPHFAGIGNHDVYAPGTHFDLHFNHPNNGGSAAFADGTMEKVEEIVTELGITNNRAINLMKNADETIYSFDYGKAHFITLNSGVYDSTGEVDDVILEGQRAWLEADLEANADALWTIVIVHQPVYHRLGGAEDRPTLYDTIEEYGVDLVIQGHSHLVTRTYPMKDGQVVDKTITDAIQKGTGTVYTTIGATAMNHDKISGGIREEIFTAFTPVMEQATYTVVDVNDTELKFTVKQINGLVVDEFTITSDENKIEYEYVSDISEYRGAEKTYPPKEGYVFAGWWQGSATDVLKDDVNLIPIAESTTGGGAWAKYVPEEALSVKAQTSNRIADNPASTKLRFVSSVDSLRYKEVGFKVKYNGGNKEYTHDTKTVYEKILAFDDQDIQITYAPTAFAAVSDYFITYTVTKIDQSLFDNYEFDVTPYWITLDGTTVKGVAREDLVIMDQLYCAAIGETKYITLEEAVKAANETEGTDTITLLQNMVVSSTLDITDSLIINSNQAVTITRDSSMTGNLFNVSSGTLQIIGANDAKIVIDGNAGNSAVSARAVNVAAGATFKMTYGTIEKFYSNAWDYAGVAILNLGTVDIQNSEISNNKYEGNSVGGAIRTEGSPKLYITDTLFNNNISSSNGAALRVNYVAETGDVKLTRCTFTNNTSAGEGGAIYYNDSNPIIMEDCTFTGNSAAKGGAISTMCATINGATFASGNDVYLKNASSYVTLSGKLTGLTVQYAANNVGVRIGGVIDTTSDITIIPTNYTAGVQVVGVASGIDTAVLANAVECIQVAADNTTGKWTVDNNGKLISAE